MIFSKSKDTESLTDEQLMQRIAQGNERAFEVLYSRYARLIYSYFLRMLKKDKELASDFTQEIFSKVHRNAQNFDSNKSFKTWIYSIANNQCKNEYAKMKVRSEAILDIPISTAEDRIEQVDRNTFHFALQKALLELDEPKRSVFEMRYLLDLSNSEIAESLGISEGTVKSRLFYAIKELNLQLANYKELLTVLFILILS
jgi:RNA polymerase sigma-70 factor (ECF subfamily)